MMISLFIVLVLILLLGLSYAWLTLTLTGTKQNIIRVGKLSLILDDSISKGIQLDNAVPTYLETALTGDSYHFTIENNGTVDASYELYLDDTGGLTGPQLKRFNYALKKDNKIIDIGLLSYLKDSPLQSGTISPSTKSEYDLYIWYNSSEYRSISKTYQSTLRLEATQQKSQNLLNLVKQVCDGIKECDRVAQGFTYFQQGYYNNQTKVKYVWYSGKLWFITGYDSEGNIKMMTADPQTIIPWGNSSDYEGSHVETWLNEEFLPSLNNYEKILVTDQVWNYSRSSNGNTDPIGNDKLVTSPVGLLNSWDFYQGSVCDGQWSFDYIRDYVGVVYLGNANSEGRIFLGGHANDTVLPNSSTFYGISPAVVMKNNVKAVSGKGTKEDPYRIAGDTFGKKGELLNTRYAGEYVAFGDQVNYSYRISAVENGKVKLISSHPLAKVFIDEDGDEWWLDFDFSTADGKTNPYPYRAGSGDLLHYSGDDKTNYPLGYFLNHDFLKPLNGYMTSSDVRMIAINQTFYTGTVQGGESYKNAKDASKGVNATVALPYIGDASSVPQTVDKMTELFNDEHGGVFLTNNGTQLYSIDSRSIWYQLGNYDTSGTGDGWLPTFYLKDMVKIKSGTGTKYDPYILTME